MLKLGSYHLQRDTIKLGLLILLSNLRTKLFGIPKKKRKGLIAMAKEVLRENVDKHLVYAGKGHFRFMWISDFSVALKGLSKILPHKQIGKILQFVIDQSLKRGYATSTFSSSRGVDLPYSRADSFPWLIYAVKQHQRLDRKKHFLKKNQAKLQSLLVAYQSHFLTKNGLVKKTATGDWADTIKRPSSTWNNLLSLYVAKNANSLGLKSAVNWRSCQQAILRNRFKKEFFTDYANTNMPSVDSPILALYLGLFTKSMRTKLAMWLDSQTSQIHGLCPTKAAISEYPKTLVPRMTQLVCSGYHSQAHWLHLGLMWANGLKTLNLDYHHLKKSVEKIVNKYKNFRY
jgi:hypothetical protein